MAKIKVMIITRHANRDSMLSCTLYCKFTELCNKVECLCPNPNKLERYRYVNNLTILDVVRNG